MRRISAYASLLCSQKQVIGQQQIGCDEKLEKRRCSRKCYMMPPYRSRTQKREKQSNWRDAIMKRCLLLGNATLRTKNNKLEHILPVHFVEGIAKPARRAELIRLANGVSGAVYHSLINAYVCLNIPRLYLADLANEVQDSYIFRYEVPYNYPTYLRSHARYENRL